MTTAPVHRLCDPRIGATDEAALLDRAGQLHDRAIDGVRALLELIGEDPDREGLADTPTRVVKAYLELTDRPGEPAALLARTFEDPAFMADEMIAVGPIE